MQAVRRRVSGALGAFPRTNQTYDTSAPPLRATLDATERHGPLILTNTLYPPWTSDGFHTSWEDPLIVAVLPARL